MSTSGEWVPSRANFTSLATPTQVGSGRTALVTLLHEGGHAAHFANVLQRSPFFSQERAPTSVAYAGERGRALLAAPLLAPSCRPPCTAAARPEHESSPVLSCAQSEPAAPLRSIRRHAETQSMTLDSLAGDAAWLGRYARDAQGKVGWQGGPPVASPARLLLSRRAALHGCSPPARRPSRAPARACDRTLPPCLAPILLPPQVVPWEVLEEKIASTHPFDVLMKVQTAAAAGSAAWRMRPAGGPVPIPGSLAHAPAAPLAPCPPQAALHAVGALL